MIGHSFRTCRQYPGESPKEGTCSKCQGHHASDCKYPYTKKQQLEGQIAKMMEVFGQQTTSYTPQPNNYNPNFSRQGNPNYNREYRSSRPNDGYNGNNNNNYQGRRGQSDYRRNGYRPYTPGPGRSGYRRNYNNSNDYKPNRSGYNGGPRYPEKTYGGNGLRYDQRQIQKREEMLKEMKQQKFNGHVSNGQGTGLGNDGHQPLNSSVVLDAMDGSYQHQSQ